MMFSYHILEELLETKKQNIRGSNLHVDVREEVAKFANK